MLYCLAQKLLLDDHKFVVTGPSVPRPNGLSWYMSIASPPAPSAEYVRQIVKVSECVKQVWNRKRGMAIMGMLLGFEGKNQSPVLQIRDCSVMTWIIR
jgi:hypothetical protein